MLLVKSTTLKKLVCSKSKAFAILCTFICLNAAAQDNSPYSRYGLGNQSPTTNIANRGMGGIAATYSDPYTVNYSNPASYSFFQTQREVNSKKLNSGRVVLNIGADLQSRTLIDERLQTKFTSPNIHFSHVMVGLPIRKNWGMAFGLRPLTSINYKIAESGIKNDPNTNLPIDSSSTLFQGQGGTYLASLGTAVKFKTAEKHMLSLGVNAGYMFGNRDYSTRLSFYNDSTVYQGSNHQNISSIKGIYFDAGLQYMIRASDKINVTVGAFGNWQQKINTSYNTIDESAFYSAETGKQSIDTALSRKDVPGNIMYPASITGGISIQKFGAIDDEAGWLIGADFTHNNWNQFRENGIPDTAIRSNWQAKIGAEFHPAPKKSYLSRTQYRVGFFTGPDYIYTRSTQLPMLGITAGVGLPINNFSPQSPYQASMINMSFEYIKRGNKDNLLRENMFRFSLGFSLTDLWFIGKTKYFED